MKVLILSDGRAGHVNQARAIAMALERNFSVSVTTVRVNLRAGFLRYLLRGVLNRRAGRLPAALWKWFHKGDALPPETPDLIVSAGGHTSGANAWLSNLRGCRNLFCGDIRGLRPTLFSGIISAYDEDAARPGFIVSPTPVVIDRAALEEKAAQWRTRRGMAATRCWGLLAGGDGAGYTYTRADWQRLANELAALARQHGIRWLLTTSRRSGPEAAAALRSIAPEYIADTALAGEPGDLSYHEILGASERIFVTEDSHMMISEAIATGKPVHTLQPESFRTDESNLHFLKLYESKGWISRHPIEGAGGVDYASMSRESREPPGVLEELAEKLAVWWRQQEITP